MKKSLVILFAIFLFYFLFIVLKNSNEKDYTLETSNNLKQIDLSIYSEKLKAENSLVFLIKDFDSFSYYYINLTNKIIIHNEVHSMPSASMIKLFIMAKAMEDIHNGALDPFERILITTDKKFGGSGFIQYETGSVEYSIYELIEKMIIDSDNTATNLLIDRIKFSNINEFLQRNNYFDTKLQRKMLDYNAISMGKDNYTSTKDLANLLENIYWKKCISEELDNQMLEILLRQKDNDKIPLYLNPEAKVAHKTGEIDNVINDGGIIFSHKGDYIIVIMTNDFKGSKKTNEMIGKVAKFFYDHDVKKH